GKITRLLLTSKERPAMTVRQAVKEAINHMGDQFTLDDVREHISRKYPQIIATTGPRSIGARLSEAYSEEKIIVPVQRGTGGKPTVYERVKRISRQHEADGSR